MSHVDEGVLHAYLDGGLSALDAVRVERHVADCGACRQRLDQARGLIQRAARLLEWASPPTDRAAPPLADLRPAPGGVPRWRVPVAWAATIVIALGAGIYGGQLILSRPEQAAVADSVGKDGLLFHDRRAAPITVAAEAESQPRQDAAKTPATPTEQAQAGVAGAGVVRESTVALNRLAPTPAGAFAFRDAAAARPVDSTRRLEQDSLRALAAAIDTATERRQLAPAPAAPTEPQVRIGGVPVAAARARRAPAYALSTTWPVITRDSAARLLQTAIVALPDVPITAVRATGDGVVVEHVVPPGQVIRLVQRRVAEGEGAEAGRGSELLARYIGGLRVEISGPMAPDSLSRLLERVRAMP